jgi:hypothetical protein
MCPRQKLITASINPGCRMNCPILGWVELVFIVPAILYSALSLRFCGFLRERPVTLRLLVALIGRRFTLMTNLRRGKSKSRKAQAKSKSRSNYPRWSFCNQRS